MDCLRYGGKGPGAGDDAMATLSGATSGAAEELPVFKEAKEQFSTSGTSTLWHPNGGFVERGCEIPRDSSSIMVNLDELVPAQATQRRFHQNLSPPGTNPTTDAALSSFRNCHRGGRVQSWPCSHLRSCLLAGSLLYISQTHYCIFCPCGGAPVVPVPTWSLVDELAGKLPDTWCAKFS